MKARLLGHRELAPGTRHFDFEALDWDGVFLPGQFLSLTANLPAGPITRAYSIATPSDFPVSLIAAAGEPAVVTVKKPEAPVMNGAALAEVIDAVCVTVNVKYCTSTPTLFDAVNVR